MTQGVAQDQGIAKLVLPREEALSQLQAQFKKGAQVKALRIRNQHDLDTARSRKLAWTNQTNELLHALFGGSSVADQCNDWVGKIYPEYAELGNFVEQFYAEMEHRLKKLKAVISAVQKTPTATRSTTESTATAAHESLQVDAEKKVAPPVRNALHGALIQFNADEPSKKAVEQFLGELGIKLSVVAEPVAEGLEKTVAEGAGFAVVIQGESAGDRAFELGLCVGRLGIHRVCVLHPAHLNFSTSAGGISHLGIDPAGGWQLSLAKQLKRSGLEIDLNCLIAERR